MCRIKPLQQDRPLDDDPFGLGVGVAGEGPERSSFGFPLLNNVCFLINGSSLGIC